MSRARGLVWWVCFATCLGACDKERWRVDGDVRAPDADVAAALGDTAQQNSFGLAAADAPPIAYPRALRPCCAFGVDLKVALGRVPIPDVEIGNVVDPSAIGPHRFDSGYLSFRRADPRGMVDDENNGLVYTCRVGFIDLAHVRDNADNTVALAAALARSLETGATVPVPPQGVGLIFPTTREN